MRELLILRGLPGSGKSTLARLLASLVKDSVASVVEICADDCWAYPYWEEGNEFTADGLKAAHCKCKDTIREHMELGTNFIILHNTNTTPKEFGNYVKLGDELGYRVHTLVVENRHGSESIHGVPEEALERMRGRFHVEL